MALAAGTRLGAYEVKGALGAGGMGEVYRARDPRLRRDVAIKVLPDRLTGDPSALARFEREAKALAALSHPNILTIFDVGSENGISFVVMELLPGETLSSELLNLAPTGLRRSGWESRLRMAFQRRTLEESLTAI
jgi:serine/threonine protein kinase